MLTSAKRAVCTPTKAAFTPRLVPTLRRMRRSITVRKSMRAAMSPRTRFYFSVFKRGMRGTYQHCSEKHLHRYLAEFDFRYNNCIALGVNDADRASELTKGIVGKRLTYRRPNRKADTAPN